MIGRGALGNPWIFKEIKNYYDETPYKGRTMLDLIDVCIKHVVLLEENKNKVASINLSKKHLNFYIKNFTDSSLWRKKIMKSESIKDIKTILNNMKECYIEEKSLN